LKSFRAAALFLMELGLAAGCRRPATAIAGDGTHSSHPGSAGGGKGLTRKGVNSLAPGLSEAQIVAALGSPLQRYSISGPDDLTLVYAMKRGARADVMGGELFTVHLTKGKLISAGISDGAECACGCDVAACSEPGSSSACGAIRCTPEWANGCMDLYPEIFSDPAHGGDASLERDWAASGKIVLDWDPVERRPDNAEHLADLVAQGTGGYGTVQLVSQPHMGWHVQSAWITRTADYARAHKLQITGAVDLREPVHEILTSGGLEMQPFSEGSQAAIRSIPGVSTPALTGHVFGQANPSADAGTVRSISASFSDADLMRLHERLNARPFQDRLGAYTCGDPSPRISFTVSIKEAAEYQERQVLIQPRPVPSPVGRQRCLMFGIDYELALELAEIDHGEPINYRYKDPHTSKEFPPGVYQRKKPVQPVCACENRDSGNEWVTWPAAAGDK
jgi:hypothetical protein